MRGFLAGAVVALCLAAPARAELAAGVLDGAGDAVVVFDTTAPGEFASVRAITGLTASERIVGIDYRYFPIGDGASAPGLFAVGIVDEGATDTARLYRLDPTTGALTAVSIAPITGLNDGGSYGVSFDPRVDRVRVVSDADENFRVNPNNGARADAPTPDTDLSPAGVSIDAVAHDRNDTDAATSTTTYAINLADHTLGTIGGIDSSPSPNLGAYSSLGPLGIVTAAPSSRSLEISPGGTAYLAAVTLGTLRGDLYTVNLGTGGATLVGTLAAPLRGFAVMSPASLQFSAADAAVTEGGIATLTVTRIGDPSSTATVDYQARGGSASGADFSSASGTLTFAGGETSKTIAVNTSNDVADEADETVTVALSNPNASTIVGAPNIVTLTIADDDPTPEAPAAPAAPDTTAPTLTLGALPARLALAKLLERGVKATATPGEPVALEFLLLGTVKNARISAADNLTLVRRRLKLGTGARSTTLRPPRRLVGRPRKAFRVRVRVIATDAAGNRRTVGKGVKITVPRRASSSRRPGR